MKKKKSCSYQTAEKQTKEASNLFFNINFQIRLEYLTHTHRRRKRRQKNGKRKSESEREREKAKLVKQTNPPTNVGKLTFPSSFVASKSKASPAAAAEAAAARKRQDNLSEGMNVIRRCDFEHLFHSFLLLGCLKEKTFAKSCKESRKIYCLLFQHFPFNSDFFCAAAVRFSAN